MPDHQRPPSKPAPARYHLEPPHLLIVEAGRTVSVSLPSSGSVDVGSSEDAAVTIPALAPVEFMLELGSEGDSVAPVAGHALINGKPLRGRHGLSSGDIIRVGEIDIGFVRKPGRGVARDVFDARQLRCRLTEETERFLRYGGPFSLLIVDLGEEVSCAGAASACSKAVRVVDVIGCSGPSELAVILPHTSESVDVPSRRVMRELAGLAPGARAGIARCPADACDPDSLLTGARLAASVAAAGDVARVDDAAERISLEEGDFLVADPVMRSLFDLLRRLAASDLPVLINGETGVGKDVVARALHAWSPRRARRMMAINCAAIPESLLESELFGHEKGAFSGAQQSKPGLFEQGAGGTVFLDEVGDCAPIAQAKLLRVLETKRVQRVGATHERAVDARLVSATNRALEEEIDAGRFRKDLFFRLSAATVVVPPLRERPLEIPVLARRFLNQARAALSLPPLRIADAAMKRLLLHTWPGNVRELKNVMGFVAAATSGDTLEPHDIPDRIGSSAAPWMLSGASKPDRPLPHPPGLEASAGVAPTASPSAVGDAPRAFRNIYDEIAELERSRIAAALQETGGVRVRAAELIGMPLRTMLAKIKRYGIAVTKTATTEPEAEPTAKG